MIHTGNCSKLGIKTMGTFNRKQTQSVLNQVFLETCQIFVIEVFA